ncbi:MAG: glycosyltransferase [Rhodothermia bacterium]
MSRSLSSVAFAMTGVLHRNGRALRQIRLLQRLAERVDVIAGDANMARELFDGNVHLHGYDLPTTMGVRFFWDVHQRVRKLAAVIDSDVFHASDLYVLPAMAKNARRRNAGLVYDAREFYPFVQGTVGKPWATFFWSQLEARFAPRADVVMTVSDSIADRIQDTYGIRRPVVVHNVPDRSRVEASRHLRENLPISESTVLVLHLGQIRQGRGCETLVRAMRSVGGAALVFVGTGPERNPLRALVTSEGVESKVFFLDPVPYDQVLDVAAGADVGVSLLEDTCLNHRFALPNKLFEYLMAGLPTIVSDFPELGRVVKEFDVGLAVDPSKPDMVALAIQKMVDDEESRLRWQGNTSKVTETFSWSNASDTMTRAYQTLGIGGPT